MKKIISLFVFLLATIGILAQKDMSGDIQKGMDCYENKDYDSTYRIFSKAANEGNTYAQCLVGFLYEVGHGVSQDYNEAMKWYRKSAENGNYFGQLYVGKMYENGWGVSPDYKLAAEWYQKAAEKGYADAQKRLGNLYMDGKGVN